MRWLLAGITISFLGVACSAPDESAIFEDTATVGMGGASSVETTATSSTGSNEGGAGAEASDVGGSSGTSTGPGSATTGSGGSSSSIGGGGGAGGSTLGTATGGGAGGSAGVGGAATTSSSTSSGGVAGSGGGGCTPSEEVCDGVDNDCDDEADDDVCPSGCVGASFEKHTYLFCDRPGVVGNNEPRRSWEQALQFCANRGFLLTLVETEAENTFIYRTLVRLELGGDVWMGATDQNDENWWRWAAADDPDEWIAFYDAEANEPIEKAFNDWREGEPNNDGGEDCGIFEDLGSDERAWDDRNCELEYDLFVCESAD